MFNLNLNENQYKEKREELRKIKEKLQPISSFKIYPDLSFSINKSFDVKGLLSDKYPILSLERIVQSKINQQQCHLQTDIIIEGQIRTLIQPCIRSCISQRQDQEIEKLSLLEFKTYKSFKEK